MWLKKPWCSGCATRMTRCSARSRRAQPHHVLIPRQQATIMRYAPIAHLPRGVDLARRTPCSWGQRGQPSVTVEPSSFTSVHAQNVLDNLIFSRATDPVMSRLATILVLFIVSVGADIAEADARLVGQGVRGARRSCLYENRGSDRARLPYRETIVGAGEPCPFHYRVVPAQRPSARPIPPMATLSTIPPRATFTRSASRSDGRQLCVYTYLGVDYVRLIPQTRQCPLTPHLLPQ